MRWLRKGVGRFWVDFWEVFEPPFFVSESGDFWLGLQVGLQTGVTF